MEPEDEMERKLVGDQLEWVLINNEGGDDGDDKKNVLKQDIIEMLQSEAEGLTRKEISVILGVGSNNNTFQRAWNELKEEKHIIYRDKKFHHNSIM
jgi:DNA invertase Pin-like site-specific DNA recombinase